MTEQVDDAAAQTVEHRHLCRHCKRDIVEQSDGTWAEINNPQPLICWHTDSNRHAPVTETAPLTGDCGECDQPEQFEWDITFIIDRGPVIVCKTHSAPGPGWVYERDDIGFPDPDAAP